MVFVLPNEGSVTMQPIIHSNLQMFTFHRTYQQLAVSNHATSLILLRIADGFVTQSQPKC